MNPSGGCKDDTEGEVQECGEEKAISAKWEVQKDKQCGHAQSPVAQGAGFASGPGRE